MINNYSTQKRCKIIFPHIIDDIFKISILDCPHEILLDVSDAVLMSWTSFLPTILWVIECAFNRFMYVGDHADKTFLCDMLPKIIQKKTPSLLSLTFN